MSSIHAKIVNDRLEAFQESQNKKKLFIFLKIIYGFRTKMIFLKMVSTLQM